MSVQFQIDRINSQVKSQSDILYEIMDVLDKKGIAVGDEGIGSTLINQNTLFLLQIYNSLRA